MIQKFFAPAKNSTSANFALLILRLWIGVEMMVLHGVDKLMNFSTASPDFPDPLGIGRTASLTLVVFAEVFASLLLVVGLFTRFAALVLIIDMTVAFVLIHKGALSGEHSGELAFLYLLVYFVLFLAGPGRVSADKIFFGKNPTAPSTEKKG
jgi:putative oxidoreductase